MTQLLNSVIIDDEIAAANNLELTLKKYCPEVNNLGKAHSLGDGVNLINALHPQLVFLDISLSSNETGFDLLDIIPEHYFKTIFVTAHSNFCLKAIKQRAFDYILKPIDYKELIRSIQELKILQPDNLPKVKPKVIPIPSMDGTHLIKPEEILYCKADGSYTHFFLTNNKKLILSKSMKHAEKILPSKQFLRIHRSYIVNINRVSKLHMQDGGYLEVGKANLPISKSYLDRVIALYS